MHIQKLATYSSERYYLLSEIEQRAEFLFIDEPDSKEKECQSTQNPRINTVYMLWDAKDDVLLLKNNIKKILELFPCCQSRCMVTVDCLVTSERDFDTVVKDQIEELFAWAKNHYPDIFIFVGVADKPSGTPGLEKLEDFMKNAVEAAPGVTGNFRVIGMTRRDCLGHDPDREPDADSDVFQVLCCGSAEECTQWEAQLLEYVKKLYDGVETSPAAALTGSEAAGFRACGSVALFSLLAVAVVVLGLVVQYLYGAQLQPKQD